MSLLSGDVCISLLTTDDTNTDVRDREAVFPTKM